MYNTTTMRKSTLLRVKGTDLSPSDQRAALMRYVHRYTAEHVPTWALKPRATGDYCAPQFRSDVEWLENTTFRTHVVGGRTRLGGECETTGQTWPFGKSLPAPYSARSNQPDL